MSHRAFFIIYDIIRSFHSLKDAHDYPSCLGIYVDVVVSCVNQGKQPRQMSDPLGRQAQKVSELVASDLKGSFTS